MYRLPLIITVVFVVAVVAGCGSSSSSSSSSEKSETTAQETETSPEPEPGETEPASTEGSSSPIVETAAKAVAHFEEEPQEISVNTPLSKAPPKGQSIAYLAANVEGVKPLLAGFEAATKAIGWKFIQIPFTAGDPSSLAAAMEKAVAQNPDYIVSSSNPVSLFSKGLAEAKAKGIPVLNQFTTEPYYPDGSGNGLYYIVDEERYYQRQGKLLADYVIANTEGKGSAVIVNIPEYPVLEETTKAAVAELGKCSECESGTIEQSITDAAGGKTASLVTAYLQQHPDTEYIILTAGEMDTGLRAALASAGVGEDTKIISGYPLQTNVEAVAEGTETAALALAQEEATWRIVDAAARLSVGDSLKPIEGKFTTTYMQTENNVGEKPELFQGAPEFEKQYEELWGLK
jgi:ABC-type sugar transport system substrate-binding protein